MTDHTSLFALRTKIDILAGYTHNFFLQGLFNDGLDFYGNADQPVNQQDRFAANFVGQKSVISDFHKSVRQEL